MYILQRYIIRQHVGPFLFGFFIITLLWILNLLFTRLGHLLSRGLSVWVILEFFFLNMAWIMALTLPMAVLMACLMAFGRLSADLEITAMKASGINMYRVIAPVFIVSILLCLFLIYFNNNILPDANHRLSLLMRDIHKKRPTLTLEPGIIYTEIPNINLMVQDVEEQENLSYVRGVLIHDISKPNVNVTISAEHGEIYVDENTGTLKITLFNGEMHEININEMDKYRRLKFPKQVIVKKIPDMVLTRSESEYRGDREQSAQMMLTEVRENKQAIQKQKDKLATQLRTHLLKYNLLVQEVADTKEKTPFFADRTKPAIYSLKNNIEKQIRINENLSKKITGSRQIIDNHLFVISRLMVEVHKKYSIPFACIVFVLIGAPLGILTRKGGMAIGGAISLLFFLIYWSFLIGGEELADRRLLSPFWAMWIANILVGSAGIYLVLFTVRESRFIKFENLKLLIPKRFRK
ncbi:LptF/LptG family permease [candidate division KSB1 bacterium]|nr:LptF/LptG family permease [candidate division KSB1 bacterium]